MYELVNTSLPNGLIAGTHGFSTVAMTKGMPDAFRTRLESYCAYRHRTSAHDASYWRENPVNWFHVVLPQGEHVAGRVAPADFDYTGRTNRLARLLAFGRDEMPAIGGAAVLGAMANRLQEPWSGDARWLSTDKVTSQHLRMVLPPDASDAPAWRAIFGDAEGLKLAKGFARLLGRNASGRGRPIYFKASPAWDADGSKMLGLFADLINLLPMERRAGVTFATYPDAMPNGVAIQLRGVFDRDRAFDASATVSPWVDCENARVHNAAMLPAEEARMEVVSISNGEIPSATCSKRPVRNSVSSRTNQLPIKKTGFPLSVIVLIIVAVVVVGGSIAWGLKLIAESQRSNSSVASGQNQTPGDQKTKTAGGTAPTKCDEPSQKAAADAEADRERKKAEEEKSKENAANERRRREQQERERAKEERRAEIEQANREKVEADKLAHEKVAFKDSAKVCVLSETIESKLGKEMSKAKITNGSMRVFYYDKTGNFTNESAGFKPSRIWGASPQFTPSPAELKRRTGGAFWLWYYPEKTMLYWEWIGLEDTTRGKWFAKSDEVNLCEMCFGKTQEVLEVWTVKVGTVRFSISVDPIDEKGKPLNRATTNATLSLEFFDPNSAEAKADRKQRLEKAQGELDKCLDRKTKIEGLAKNLEGLNNKLFAKTEEMKKKKGDKPFAPKNAKKGELKKLEEDQKKEAKKLQSEIKELENKIREKARECKGIGNVANNDDYDSIKKRLDMAVKDIERKIEDAKRRVKAIEDEEKANGDWRDQLRKREFRITAVEDGMGR